MDEVKSKSKPVEKPERAFEKRDNTADMRVVFDTSKDGLQTVMKKYQEICMRFMWERGEEGVTSVKAWVQVNKVLIEKERIISRAPIILFMNDMVDIGILNYTEKTGKGGYHRVYFPAYDEKEFKMHVSRTVISKLLDIWPSETREIIKTLGARARG